MQDPSKFIEDNLHGFHYNYDSSNKSFKEKNNSFGEKQETYSFVDPSDSFSGQKSQKSWNTFDVD